MSNFILGGTSEYICRPTKYHGGQSIGCQDVVLKKKRSQPHGGAMENVRRLQKSVGFFLWGQRMYILVYLFIIRSGS